MYPYVVSLVFMSTAWLHLFSNSSVIQYTVLDIVRAFSFSLNKNIIQLRLDDDDPWTTIINVIFRLVFCRYFLFVAITTRHTLNQICLLCSEMRSDTYSMSKCQNLLQLMIAL